MDKLTDDDEEDDAEETFLNDIYHPSSENCDVMTKYPDAETLSSFLSEKEKDLELAAKIGKSLLERNKELQKTNEFLEEQVNLANDHVTQLKHELQQKVDLLQLFTELESESGGTTPSSERFSNWNILQKKLFIMEEENLCLKLEASHLKSLTQSLEEKEHQLIGDCLKQFAEANVQVDQLSRELAEKNEQCSSHKRQMDHMQKELSQKHNIEKKLSCENEELTIHLRAAQETQMELAQELADLQDRYAEIVAMLTETREELKNVKDNDYFRGGVNSSFPDSVYDSLASELEASDNGPSITYTPFITPYKRKKTQESQNNLLHLMESLKNSLQKEEAKQKKKVFTHAEFNEAKTSTPIKVPFGQEEANFEFQSGDSNFNGSGWKAKRISQEIEMGLQSSPFKYTYSKDSLSNYKTPGIGVPGKPGSKDLEYAIKRLSLRRRVELEFQKYRQEKEIRPLPFIGYANNLNAEISSGLTSLLEREDSNETEPKSPTSSKSRFVLVKPLDGSDTLAQWKELAKPSFSAGVKRLPGVKVKGGSPPIAPSRSTLASKVNRSETAVVANRSGLDSGICSDVETSVNISNLRLNSTPSIANLTTPGTYSFVSSRVMHPSGDTAAPLNFSQCSTSGTSTFSTALNLAQALKERCVDVVAGTWWEWPKRESPMMINTENRPTKMSLGIMAQEHFNETKSTGLESLLDETDNFTLNPSQFGIITRASMRRGKPRSQSKV